MLTPLEVTALSSAVVSGTAGFAVGFRINEIRGLGWLHGTWTELHPRVLAEQIRTGQIKLTSLDKRTQTVVLAEMARQANGLTAAESADFLALDGVTGRFTHMAPPTNHPDYAHDYRKQG